MTASTPVVASPRTLYVLRPKSASEILPPSSSPAGMQFRELTTSPAHPATRSEFTCHNNDQIGKVQGPHVAKDEFEGFLSCLKRLCLLITSMRGCASLSPRKA